MEILDFIAANVMISLYSDSKDPLSEMREADIGHIIPNYHVVFLNAMFCVFFEDMGSVQEEVWTVTFTEDEVRAILNTDEDILTS